MANSDPRLSRADRLFSLLVRERDRECQVCLAQGVRSAGYPGTYHDLTAHHFVKRRFRKTRYVFDNAIAVCFDHHDYLEAHPKENEAFAISHIGEERYTELRELARDTRSKVDLDEVIVELRGMVA